MILVNRSVYKFCNSSFGWGLGAAKCRGYNDNMSGKIWHVTLINTAYVCWLIIYCSFQFAMIYPFPISHFHLHNWCDSAVCIIILQLLFIVYLIQFFLLIIPYFVLFNYVPEWYNMLWLFSCFCFFLDDDDDDDAPLDVLETICFHISTIFKKLWEGPMSPVPSIRFTASFHYRWSSLFLPQWHDSEWLVTCSVLIM